MIELTFLVMMIWLNGKHQDHSHYLPPKGSNLQHDTCCMYRGCTRHNHFSGRHCGLPWENDPR